MFCGGVYLSKQREGMNDLFKEEVTPCIYISLPGTSKRTTQPWVTYIIKIRIKGMADCFIPSLCGARGQELHTEGITEIYIEVNT